MPSRVLTFAPMSTDSTPPAARVVAVIPARGGSKGVPRKNLRLVGGRPLVARAVHAASRSARIDRVIVSTDDPVIADVARAAGAEVHDRPRVLATDEAGSEPVLIDVLDRLPEHPDVLVFLQATSPFIEPADLDAAIARVTGGEADSVFSGVPSHAFLWTDAGGSMVGVNHDAARRERR